MLLRKSFAFSIRLCKIAGSIIFLTAWWFWRFLRKVVKKDVPGSCVVLYYHALTVENKNRFKRQMDDFIRWANPIRADTKDLNGNRRLHAAVTFDDGFQSVLENALPVLIERKIPCTLFVPTGFLGCHPKWNNLNQSRDKNERVMTAEQLKNIPLDLVSIGAHTVTHSKLSILSNEEAERELYNSKKELELIIGRDVKMFSFPHGEYNNSLVDLARKAGYERVFTTSPAFAFSRPREFLTGRVWVAPTDWRAEFLLKLLGAYCWLPFAFLLKRKAVNIVKKCLHFPKNG